MAEIVVIVVNYGTAELSLEAVGSVLARAHGGRSVAVHLVDNASPHGDADRIRSELAARGWQDRVSFHAETENHGFGRGNNVVLTALAQAPEPPKYVFLLNPDAVLDNETLAVLADFLDAHPEAGAVGAEIRKPSDPAPVSAAFRYPGLASIFAEAVNFGPVSKLFARTKVALPPTQTAEKVDWVAGAAVMGRFEVWQKVGFFDPAYFLYFEEMDLMRQVTRAGHPIWYVPEARVIHAEGAATQVQSGGVAMRRPRPAYWYGSWRHYFSKNHGRAYAILAGLLWLLGGGIGHLVALALRRQPYLPLNFRRDFWRHGMMPLLRGEVLRGPE